MGDQTAWINKDETQITAAFKSALQSRRASGLHSGLVINLYQFEKGGVDWCNGVTYPITNSQSPFDKARGNRVSVWIRDAAEERQMRDMVSELFPLEDSVLLKPTFAAYNSKLQKTVVCCKPITDRFPNWISKQTQVPPDGYLHPEAKNMIRSVLSFAESLWMQGYVCDGLNDPQNYAMMHAHVRVLPFTIRKRQVYDSKEYHRQQFADLLENHLNIIWNDVDVQEFIECLRDPALSLDFLLNHPLLLSPERRMALYLSLWKAKFSADQKNKYLAITLYNNWVNSASLALDDVLQEILTYSRNDARNTTPTYQGTMYDAHRFARDTCSHYLKKWRSTNRGKIRPKSTHDMVDKPLKRLFPGLLSKVYAFSYLWEWNSK